jgi:hypothetical protein
MKHVHAACICCTSMLHDHAAFRCMFNCLCCMLASYVKISLKMCFEISKSGTRYDISVYETRKSKVLQPNFSHESCKNFHFETESRFPRKFPKGIFVFNPTCILSLFKIILIVFIANPFRSLNWFSKAYKLDGSRYSAVFDNLNISVI